MVHNQFLLLKDRRFAPLFVTQFLGAFHDNLFKNALVVLILYGLASSRPDNPELLVTLAAGLFILPFVLFSALGGQLADKYPKEHIIQNVKIVEIGIAIVGFYALYSGSIIVSFLVLFALGAQSAFFGPSKFSILPQHLKADELIGGNALLNTGSFLAILIGTILGTLLITIAFGKITVGFLMIIVALVGYLSSRFIPPAPPKAPDLKINWNTFTETILILKYAFDHKRNVVFALFGVGWFYFLGGMFLAQMPNYVQGSIGASEQVLAFFLVLFSIGIAVGGLLNNRLLKGDISARLTPWAVLGISVFSIDLFLATPEVVLKETIVGLGPFLSVASNWRMIFDIAMIALCGGLFVVPLNAIIQHYTEEHHRARVVAGSAIINALFVILSSLFAVVLIMIDFNIEDIFLTFGILNIGMIFFMWKLTRL